MHCASIRSLKSGGRAAAISLGILAAAGAVGAANAAGASATAASSIALNEKAQLHRTSTTGHGLTLNEQGSASGRIRGAIYIHLNVGAIGRVSAEVNIYPSGGSLSGYASARYRVVGGQAVFSGTMSITRGSGRYAHAHASGLRFDGTIERVNDATTVEVTGELSY